MLVCIYVCAYVFVCACVCVYMGVRVWCFTSLPIIFQSYHYGGCLLHETRYWPDLSAANTVAPCRRNNTHLHHPVTVSWHRASQSLFYPLNAELLSRKQPVSFSLNLVWSDRKLIIMKLDRIIHTDTCQILFINALWTNTIKTKYRIQVETKLHV